MRCAAVGAVALGVGSATGEGRPRADVMVTDGPREIANRSLIRIVREVCKMKLQLARSCLLIGSTASLLGLARVWVEQSGRPARA